MVEVPFVNSLLRRTIRSFASGSRSISRSLMRYIHVSGEIHIELEGQLVKFWSRGDDALITKLYYNRDWEKNVTYWFSKICERFGCIVDAGANIGVFSLLAAKSNTSAVVYAFEPNPNNFLRLQKNISLNNLQERIFPFQSALGNSTGQIGFFLPADEQISDVSSVYQTHTVFFNNFDHHEIKVPIMPLDSFCKERGIVPRVIKIDVELYELQVMEGMRSMLTEIRPVLFCEIFDDEVKRRLNPALHSELEREYTVKVKMFLDSVSYHPYLILSGGILKVDSFKGTDLSAMYILLPAELKQRFYPANEVYAVLDELTGD
jgi:FkbM family methyltransferase